MRQIGVLPDAIQAHTLADYLLTLRIETRVEQGAEGYALWVCDEDRVPQARQELDAFLKDPKAPQYSAAIRAADAIRLQEDEVEQDYSQRQTELRERMREPRQRSHGRYVTLAVSAVAIMIFLATGLGENTQHPALQALFIAPFRVLADGSLITWNHLQRVREGEVWRLVTPAFIHFGIPHLVFNVLVLNNLGGAIEERRGQVRYILFFLLLAVASNTAQYYLHIKWTNEGLVLSPSPSFGGLSGVGYGFFGYLWMKSRYDPDFGLRLSQNQVIVMIGLFFLCMTGLVGPIANVAHAAGLGVGMLLGIAPVWWRKASGRN